MNSCQGEPVWLVSSRLKPVNRPINRTTTLGPYLSRAHPAIKEDAPARSIFTDTIAEVAALVKANSLAIDLKKMPKERCIP